VSVGEVFTPSVLTGAQVNAFLLGECDRVSAGSVEGTVPELRSILRFLYLQDITSLRLGTAVAPVGGVAWPRGRLPRCRCGCPAAARRL
jgi:hypothetical protein